MNPSNTSIRNEIANILQDMVWNKTIPNDDSIDQILQAIETRLLAVAPEKRYSAQFGYQGIVMGIQGVETDQDKPYNEAIKAYQQNIREALQ